MRNCVVILARILSVYHHDWRPFPSLDSMIPSRSLPVKGKTEQIEAFAVDVVATLAALESDEGR